VAPIGAPDVGDVDPAAVRSLIGPTPGSTSAPLPTGDPNSGRVIVTLEVGLKVPQEQSTTLAFVDLDELWLDVPPGGLEDIDCNLELRRIRRRRFRHRQGLALSIR
jgi:hypothetical protein